MRLKKNFFDYKGLKLRYFTGGRGQPILFLHGGGLQALTYGGLLEALAQKYLVIAPDIPCFGESDVPKDIWDLQDYGFFFDQFLKQLDLNEVIVIGHSLGGGIALHLAVKNYNIARLILINSAGVPSHYPVVKFMYKFYFDEPISDLTTFYKSMPTILYLVRNFMNIRLTRFFNWDQIVSIMRKSLATKLPDLSKIRCPALIIWGDEDVVFPVADANLLHRKIKNSKLVFVNGNHNWIFSRHKKFSELIFAWIQE